MPPYTGLREGRNYASDGFSHLMHFTVGGVAMGENGSELRLPKLTAAAQQAHTVRICHHTQKLHTHTEMQARGLVSDPLTVGRCAHVCLCQVTVTLDAAAMLDTVPDEIIRAIPYSEKPYYCPALLLLLLLAFPLYGCVYN